MVVEVQSASSGHIKIELYNLLGQKVSTLADADATSGTYVYSWCGRNKANELVATGAYLLRVETPQEKKNFKAIVVK